jgi:hypothetical protein
MSPCQNALDMETHVIKCLRFARRQGTPVSVVFEDAAQGKPVKIMAKIVSHRTTVYVDEDGDLLVLVDLVFEEGDTEDDGVQALWLHQLVDKSAAPVEPNWAFEWRETDHVPIHQRKIRCRGGRVGCSKCRRKGVTCPKCA